MLTTLFQEFFMPRFLEPDDGVRELPTATYPCDGVSGVGPLARIARSTITGGY